MATAPPHVGVLRARLSAAGSWWLSWMGLLLLALLYSHGMTTEGASARPVHPGVTALSMSAAAHSAGAGPSAGSGSGSVSGPASGVASGVGRDLAAAGPSAPYNSHDVSHAAQDCLSGAVKDGAGLPAVVPSKGVPGFSYVPGWDVVRLTACVAGTSSSVASPALRI